MDAPPTVQVFSLNLTAQQLRIVHTATFELFAKLDAALRIRGIADAAIVEPVAPPGANAEADGVPSPAPSPAVTESQPAPSPAPAAVTPPAASPEPTGPRAVTKADVRKAIVAYGQAHGRAATEAVLGNHGATHIDNLAPERYAEAFAALGGKV